MKRRFVLLLTLLALLAVLAVPAVVAAQPAIAVKTLSEKKMSQLPAGALVWRVESFATRAAAEAAAGTTGLVAESGGKVWLATLGPAGGSSTGGTKVAEVGPIQAPTAGEYLIRVQELSGVPGSQAAVHTHPGSEAYYVLAGELNVRTPTGVLTGAAGTGFVGPPAGTPVQPYNAGSADVVSLVFFVVDAAQPFSSPAAFPAPAPGLPSTGAGGGPGDDPRRRTITVGLGALLLAVPLACTAGFTLLRRRFEY